jgi:MraZ protein
MEPNPSPHKKLFLIGEYDALLDDKNRILVCAAFRNEILEAGYDSSLICRIARNRVTWLYPQKYYREMIAQREMTLVTGEEEEKFNDSYYGTVFPLNWDSQGRVGIPEKIIKRAVMGRELTLVGTGDHVSIWNRDEWERRVQAIV